MKQMKQARESRPRRALVLALIVLALFLALGLLAGEPLLRFVSEPEQFRAWVSERRVLGALAYVGMVILQIVVAFIPGEPLEIAAGFAFGALEGTLLCLLASALGSVLVILLVRKWGVRLAELFFTREKLDDLSFLRSSPRRTLIFAIIFIVPGTPKDLLCYYAGLTDIRLPLLLAICTLGRIPSILTSTLGGDALGARSYSSAAIVLAVTLLISALGVILYRRILKRHRKYAVLPIPNDDPPRSPRPDDFQSAANPSIPQEGATRAPSPQRESSPASDDETSARRAAESNL